jgi:two-component system, OmpR family, phosphate regulon sensor histidine kinase PhoR
MNIYLFLKSQVLIMQINSSRQLAYIISAVLTFLAGFFILFWYYIDASLIWMLVILLVFMTTSFLILQYLLGKYISDKIKPVYKTILDLPAILKKGDQEKKGPVLSAIRNDVEEWAQMQIREIERLKELEKYRKEFVGNVSHEMKTPIFNIQGYVLTLLEGGIDDPKINKLYLQRTEASINRMISIVEDLESITKLESGELKLKFEKFDIVKLVEEVFDMEQMLAEEQGITLSFSFRPERPVYVRADKKRVTEVISNLINNGIKYGRKKGFVKVGFYDMEEHCLIEVTDNGIGLEKKDLPRIFERFFRVDKSRSRVQGGTGLGLSIVKHIIEAHNQTINVKSTPDEGTTFAFTLEKAK